MFDLRVVDQELRGIHDLGKAGLVVGAEQRGAVGGDDIVADLIGEGGMFRGADDLGRIGLQHDVAATVIPDDLWLDVRTGAIGRGVHMRAEADDRHVFVGIGRDGCVDVAEFVEMGVANPHRLQLAREQGAQGFLLFGGRAGGRGRVRLGVDDHVAQKALGYAMGEPWERSHNPDRG